METLKGDYNVTFVTDYFSMTTRCWAATYQDAVDNAIQLIEDHYGWNMSDLSKDVDIEFMGRG